MKIALAAIVLIMAATTAQDATRSPESQSPLLTADDGRIAQRAIEVFSKRHLLHPVVDDALSEKLMDRFIRSWDPQKLYFLKADISEFQMQKTQLDDQLHAGNVELANAVFQRFRQRATERHNHVGQWIDADHDFTVDESLTTDATQFDWAATDEELDERWRKQLKYELLLLKLKGYEVAESRLRLRRHYERTQALFNQTERYEILERYLNSLTKSVDPRSQFLSEETLAKYRIRGIYLFSTPGLKLIAQDGYIEVQGIIPGSAAEIDGRIKTGDRILGLAEKSATGFTDVWQLELDRIRELLRGARDTPVRIQTLKQNGAVEVYTLKRAAFPTAEDQREISSVIIDSSKWIDGTDLRIGVLSLPEFSRDFREASSGKEFESTARDVRKVLEKWNAENVDAIMLDLRGNIRGPFAEVLDLFRLFAGKGSFVQVSEADEPVTSYESEDPVDPEICWQKPLVIICDRKTSGSAEVLSAAIQDYQRGIVIGDASTHGNGTVQNVIDVREDASLFSATFGSVKCTIAALFRVTGNSIQYTGVTSDIFLPSLSEVLTPADEVLENAMELEPISTAKYTPFTTYVSDSIIAETSNRSRARVLNNPDFKIVEDQIQRHVKQTNEKSVSLNLTDTESRMKELKAETDLAGPIESNRKESEVFPRNYYNTEVVHIATDYIQLLKAM